MQSIKTFEPWVEASGILKDIIEEEHYVLLDFGTFEGRSLEATGIAAAKLRKNGKELVY